MPNGVHVIFHVNVNKFQKQIYAACHLRVFISLTAYCRRVSVTRATEYESIAGRRIFVRPTVRGYVVNISVY